MKSFDITALTWSVECENGGEAALRFEPATDGLRVYLTAAADAPTFARVKWAWRPSDDLRVLGDAWERSYADLGFLPITENDRDMPWYFAAADRHDTLCFGVRTQPSAFVSFRLDGGGLSATLDVRSGGCGVRLGGRELCLCEFVLREYPGADPVAALAEFCKALCPAPRPVSGPIFGSNDWYYAYGDNTGAQILRDAACQAELAEGLPARPYVVIDDGWELSSCRGPWLPNEKYGDMASLAAKMSDTGVLPGIWMRPLHNVAPCIPDDWRVPRGGKREYLDPTVPGVQALIRADIRRIRGWGFRLLKHDFTTFDLFGDWGRNFTRGAGNCTDWHFADRSRTNAEITLDLYRLIREEAGDMVVIGCNTISHLSAGLFELQRIGDDTSGRDWVRTRDYGVNTLAFRLCQHGAFYFADADCVGDVNGAIPWEKNRQWLDLLALSGTALFVSLPNMTPREKADVANAYRRLFEKHDLAPVDILSKTPSRWRLDGEEIVFDWSDPS